MGLFDKLKHRASGSTSIDNSFANPASAGADVHARPDSQTLGQTDVFRYRKQRGINLGSWFVLERWICPQVFRGAAAPGQSDFDVASGENAKQILESHWDEWIRDEDWKWIKERGFNSVRIPVSSCLYALRSS